MAKICLRLLRVNKSLTKDGVYVADVKILDLALQLRILAGRGQPRSTNHVRRSVWNRKEQQPKTANAIRVVDIPEPLAKALQEYITGKSGFLFATHWWTAVATKCASCLPHRRRHVRLHALRRFRTETLRRERVPEDLVRLWLGHARRSVTDTHARGLADDLAWRQEWANRVGLGFVLGCMGLQMSFTPIVLGWLKYFVLL